jgi:hypothetical protein
VTRAIKRLHLAIWMSGIESVVTGDATKGKEKSLPLARAPQMAACERHAGPAPI